MIPVSGCIRFWYISRPQFWNFHPGVSKHIYDFFLNPVCTPNIPKHTCRMSSFICSHIQSWDFKTTQVSLLSSASTVHVFSPLHIVHVPMCFHSPQCVREEWGLSSQPMNHPLWSLKIAGPDKPDVPNQYLSPMIGPKLDHHDFVSRNLTFSKN